MKALRYSRARQENYCSVSTWLDLSEVSHRGWVHSLQVKVKAQGKGGSKSWSRGELKALEDHLTALGVGRTEELRINVRVDKLKFILPHPLPPPLSPHPPM